MSRDVSLRLLESEAMHRAKDSGTPARAVMAKYHLLHEQESVLEGGEFDNGRLDMLSDFCPSYE